MAGGFGFFAAATAGSSVARVVIVRCGVRCIDGLGPRDPLTGWALAQPADRYSIFSTEANDWVPLDVANGTYRPRKRKRSAK